MKKQVFLLLLLLCCFYFSQAQNGKVESDTLIVRNDSVFVVKKELNYVLVAISLNAQSTVFRRDSFVDYGGGIAYKVEVVSLEVVKDMALINARRLEILRQIDGLVLELEYLDDLKSQWETLDMGGMSIMQNKTGGKLPAKKPVAPKKQPANSNTKPSKPKKQ